MQEIPPTPIHLEDQEGLNQLAGWNDRYSDEALAVRYPEKRSTNEMTFDEYGDFLLDVSVDWHYKRASFELRDSKVEMEDFSIRVGMFESKHSLEELNAITDLTPQEAPNHPVRELARKDAIPLSTQLSILKMHRDANKITEEQYQEMRQKYKIVSQAVGIINNNKVDHTR